MHAAPLGLPRRLLAVSPLALALAIPTVLWAVLFITLPPARQNFPLNDDWAYSRGAFALDRGEGIHYYRQGSMPLLGQWLWSWPFVRAFGESHAVLRLSTLCLAGLGLAAFYWLLRQQPNVPPGEAAIATAALALNPLFFMLACTYMSDVPALAFSLVALSLYARAARPDGHGYGWLVVAALVASLATLTRQNAVAAPLAAAALVWSDPHKRWHPAWVSAILAPLVAGVMAYSWFGARPDAVELGPQLPGFRQLFVLGMVSLHTLGLVALPVLVLRPANGSWTAFVLALWAVLVVAFLADSFSEFFPYGELFPFVGNMLTPWGALEFRPNYLVVGERPLLMGDTARLTLTLLGYAGAVGLLCRLFTRGITWFRSGPLGWFALVHLAILLLSPNLFDRYLLVLMPAALSLAGSSTAPPRRYGWPAAAALLAVAGLAAAALTHDWLAWNSARWELGRRAVSRGIDPCDVEGGLEWDSWHSPVAVAPEGILAPRQGLVLPFNQQRFPHLTGRYALSFSQPRGTVTLDSEPYEQWLLPGRHTFYFVQEQPRE